MAADRRSTARQKKRRRKKIFRITLLVIIFVLLVAVIAMALKVAGNAFAASNKGGSLLPALKKTTTTTTTPLPHVVSTATVGSSGDVVIHTPVLRSAKTGSGTYDFFPMLQHLKPFVSKMDYSVVNFEFGIGKGENDYYQPEMLFRVPPTLVDNLMNTGYDLGLCANNHVTNGSSLTLTAQTYLDKGVDFTGLRRTTADKRYLVKDINGIKIGFVNYTYTNGTPSTTSLVNYFNPKNLDAFYSDMQQQISDMKTDGAEAIVVYMHWGSEYQIVPTATEKAIAQKMCDLGVDVTVGGHPHKIQPLELIKSDNGNQMVCLYSMGNLLSNQVIEAMYGGNASNSPGHFQDGGVCRIPDVMSRYADTRWDQHDANCNDNGHTEDGLLFQYSFQKYSDGSVHMSGVDVLPLWCYRQGTKSSGFTYRVIPLETDKIDAATLTSKYGVQSRDVVYAQRSYDRTEKQVAAGITACNQYCQSQITAYLDNVKNGGTTTTATTTTATP